MARHIHIHLHRKPTADSWNESDHPRADNGQFGSGGGGKKPAPASGGSSDLRHPADPKAEVTKAKAKVAQAETIWKAAGSSEKVRLGAELEKARGELTAAENHAAGLEKAHKEGEHLRQLKKFSMVSTPEGQGIYHGLNQHGQPLVEINGKVATFHPTKVNEKTKTGSFKAGGPVFSSSFSTTRQGVYQGPDPDSKNHALVKFGNSLKSVPTHQLHGSKEEADKN